MKTMATDATIRKVSIGIALSLVASLGVPLASAQRPSADVNLELRFVQARPAAAAALANKRVAGPGRSQARRTAKFADTSTPTVHVFDKQGGIRGLINSEQAKGAARQLSQPQLVTESGRETRYALGGRYPVPVVLDSNAHPRGAELPPTPRMPEEDFGIRIQVLPIELPDGTVLVRVHAQARGVDFTRSTMRGAYRIPALVTNEVKDEVLLESGQSFAITGMEGKGEGKGTDIF